jgi:clathrin heavy chain
MLSTRPAPKSSCLGPPNSIANPPQADSIAFNSCTLESDHYVCIRQQSSDAASPELVIIDLKNNNNVTKRSIKADNAILHWTRQIIALKAQSRTLQVFDLEKKAKLKSTTMNEDVVFWKWISETSLGLVTSTSVYHWNVFEESQAAPVKVFDRNTNLAVRVLPLKFHFHLTNSRVELSNH